MQKRYIQAQRKLLHHRRRAGRLRNAIDEILNENKQIKVKNNSLETQLKDFKEKLERYDFAYKYITKELESRSAFSLFYLSKVPDESFITASNVTANLTKELIERDRKIEKLEILLKQFKSEEYHNTTL